MLRVAQFCRLVGCTAKCYFLYFFSDPLLCDVEDRIVIAAIQGIWHFRFLVDRLVCNNPVDWRRSGAFRLFNEVDSRLQMGTLIEISKPYCIIVVHADSFA